MPTARDKPILKQRVDEYLWGRAPGLPLVRLRRILDEHFSRFEKVGILGGLVRDLARDGRPAFNSDVDLVIDASPREVEKLARSLNARPNRFGGFAYLNPYWKIDFWALQATWASTHGHVLVGQLEDIIKCTFFDWDGVLYEVKRRKLICAEHYFDLLRSRTMDITLLPNPSIEGNLLRAIRRAVAWNLILGPRLKVFISNHLDEQMFETLRITDSRLHSGSILGHFENAATLKAHLFAGEERTRPVTTFAQQLRLPLFR